MPQSREERVATLATANRERHARKRRDVEGAIKGLLRANDTVTISSVAKRANVSRNFVYVQTDLLEVVREVAHKQPHRLRQSGGGSSAEASLRARLVLALDGMARAKEKVERLEATVERLTGEVAHYMEADRSSSQPSGIPEGAVVEMRRPRT